MGDGRLDRRLLLRRLGQSGALLGASGVLTALGLGARGRFRPPSAALPVRDHRVSAVPGLPPLVRAAIGALGGMERFVKRGEHVLVKPNMAWDRSPEQGANTHPQVVAEV